MGELLRHLSNPLQMQDLPTSSDKGPRIRVKRFGADPILIAHVRERDLRAVVRLLHILPGTRGNR